MHIILIARHFPPEISGGARRPFLLTNALRKLGHRVTIVTPFANTDDQDHVRVENAAISRGDQKRGNNTPVQTPRLERLKAVIRTNLFWPDPDIRWARSVVAQLRQAKLNADVIVTTSPPESSHLAGARLGRALNLPWVAEFRDTWVRNPHREILEKSAVRACVERRIARRALASARGVTAVSEYLLEEARDYVRPGTPELVLPHFTIPLDEDYTPQNLTADRINLVHTGSFTLSDRRRKLGPLLDMIASGLPDNPALMLHIAGELTPEEAETARTSPVDVVQHGLCTLSESRGFQKAADALILYTPEESHALPGKYVEYASSGRPIYYVGNGGWTQLLDEDAIIKPLQDSITDITRAPADRAYKFLSADVAAKHFSDFLQQCLN